MSIPGFTAGASVGRNGPFGARPREQQGASVVPAIPFCDNCIEILDRCERNGFRPRALCLACLTGDCFSGVERPPHLLEPGLPRHFW
jgi:hypothetical protein